MTDVESQQDEISALKSIFTEEEFTSTVLENGSHSGQFYAYIQLPSDFYLTFMKAEELADCHQIALQHLPPIELSFELPQDYPSQSPPVFTLSCPWISPQNLFKFCSCLDNLWDENKGLEIIYIWAQFLKEESLRFLKIEKCLDISHVYQNELRRAKTHCIDRRKNIQCFVDGDGEAPYVNNTDMNIGLNEQKSYENSESFIQTRSAVIDRCIGLAERCKKRAKSKANGDNKYGGSEETALESDKSAETRDEFTAKNCGVVASKSARDSHTNWGSRDELTNNKPVISTNDLSHRRGRCGNYESSNQMERGQTNNRSPGISDSAGNTDRPAIQTMCRSKKYYSNRLKTNSSMNGCQNDFRSNCSRFVAKHGVNLCELNIHDRGILYTEQVSVNRKCNEASVLNARSVNTRTMDSGKVNNGSQLLLVEELGNPENPKENKPSNIKSNYSDRPNTNMSANSSQDDFDLNCSTSYVVNNDVSNTSEVIIEKWYQKSGNENNMPNKLLVTSTKMMYDINHENRRDMERSRINNDALVIKVGEFGNTDSRASNQNINKPNYVNHKLNNKHQRNSAIYSRNDVAVTNGSPKCDARPDVRNVQQGNNQDPRKQYQGLGNGNSVRNKPFASKARWDVEKNNKKYDTQRSNDEKEIGTDSPAVMCRKNGTKYNLANLNKSTPLLNSRKHVPGPNGPTCFVLKHNLSCAENIVETFVWNGNKYSQEWTPEKIQKKKRKEFRNQQNDNSNRQFDNGRSSPNHTNAINVVNNSCDHNKSDHVNSEYTLQQSNAVVNIKNIQDSTSNDKDSEILSKVSGQLKPYECVVKSVNNVASGKEPNVMNEFTFQKSNKNSIPIQDSTSNEKVNKIVISVHENLRFLSQSFPNGRCSTSNRLAKLKQKMNQKKEAIALKVLRVPLHNVPLHRFLESYNRDRAKTEFLRGMHSCIVCFEDMPGTKCMQFSPCGHTFCRDCVTGYLTVQIKEGAVQSIGCLEQKCLSTLTPQQVRELVEPELFTRYDSLLLTATLQSMSDIIYCPRPQCQYPTTLEPDATMAVCPSCQYVFCIYCKMVYHGIEPCRFKTEEKKALIQEYQLANDKRKRELESRYGRKQLSNLVETYMSENWIDENSKNCPHCNAAIEKSDGCNKMVCWRCNTFFCWMCMVQLSATTPYQHYYSRSSKCHNLLFEGANWPEEEEQGNQREQDYYIPEFRRNGIE